MRKTKLILPVVLVAAVGARIYWEGTLAASAARFPDVDKKTFRKLHREMAMEALAGKYGTEELTDEDCDRIMREKLAKINQ